MEEQWTENVSVRFEIFIEYFIQMYAARYGYIEFGFELKRKNNDRAL